MKLPPLPTLPITSTETLRKCRELNVGPRDIFICSFPKSGTTWMQNIVFQLLSTAQKRTELLPFDHISQYAPFYEIDHHWEKTSDKLIPRIEQAHKDLGYRIFNTHLRWDMLPKGTGAKYIYVVRDGRDVLTSFYHHMSNQHPEDGGFEGDFEEFFQQFLDGEIAYGKWSHHLSSWMPHSVGVDSDENILLVRYEDLTNDLKGQLERIATFLEIDVMSHPENNSVSEAMDQVLQRTSFSWMQTNQKFFHPISVRWKPGYNFIRKGSIGDHENIFDSQHRQRFLDAVIEDLGGCDVIPFWLHKYCYHSK